MSGFRHFHFRHWRHFACLPPGAPPQLRAAWRVLAPLAGALWSVMIASAWWAWRPSAMEVLGRAAVVAALAAVVCWAVAVASASLRDREIKTLARENADLLRRIPEAEQPPLLAASGR